MSKVSINFDLLTDRVSNNRRIIMLIARALLIITADPAISQETNRQVVELLEEATAIVDEEGGT